MAKRAKPDAEKVLDISRIDYERKYRIGTRFVNALGLKCKYAKVDFGIVGRDTKTGKVRRSVQYMWLPVRL